MKRSLQRAKTTPKPVARTETSLRAAIDRLLRGEITVRDFPWLNEDEKRAVGAFGMSLLEAGQAESARRVFEILVDLEPDVAVHPLMIGHAYLLEMRYPDAFRAFGQAITLSAGDADNQEVASEALLARGDLLLRIGRVVEARADLADAATRMAPGPRRRSLEVFLAA